MTTTLPAAMGSAIAVWAALTAVGILFWGPGVHLRGRR